MRRPPPLLLAALLATQWPLPSVAQPAPATDSGATSSKRESGRDDLEAEPPSADEYQRAVDALLEEARQWNESLPKTKPRTWAKYGWQKLRFGMGPGDALKRIERPDEESFDKFVGDEFPASEELDEEASQRYRAKLKESLYRQRIELVLLFTVNRLNAIILRPGDLQEVPADSNECGLWLDEVKDGLERRYGQADCDYDSCRWKKDRALSVRLSFLRHSARGGPALCEGSIMYSDYAAMTRDFERKERKREAAARKGL